MENKKVLRKLQLTELEILDVISCFCKERGISWFMDSGTCLGAVRHGGFIPWDDDIDIGMLREDYDVFCEAAARELPDGYSLHTPLNTNNYAPLFAKVYKDGTRFENEETRASGMRMGIFVDVFPYDRLLAAEDERRRQIRNASISQKRSYLYHSKVINVPHSGLAGLVERGGCVALHYVERTFTRDPSKYIRSYSASVSRAEDDSSALSCEYACLSWYRPIPFSYDELVPTKPVEFEGRSYPAPHMAEAYLARSYGDWQSIPPADKRHTHLPLLLDFGDGEIWRKED